MTTCPLHPRYLAILKPRSTRPGCICQQVYDERHGLTESTSEEREK